MLELRALHSKVKFIDGDITGRIVQIAIQDKNRVTYEVAYWTGGERKTIWVTESEIDTVNGLSGFSVGFMGNVEGGK